MVHFVTTSPTSERCGRCGRLRLAGLGDGIPYRVEPVPLNVHGELRVRLAGRRSFRLVAGRLCWRSPESITADNRPGRHRPIVFGDHACAQPATAADVDPTFLPVVARLLAANPTGTRWSESETAVIHLLGEHLDARVLETPPF